MKKKKCKKCNKMKVITEFSKNSARASGLQEWCKQCHKDNYQTHRATRLINVNIYYHTHKKYWQQYYQDHKDKLNEYGKQYYQDHKKGD